MKKVIIITGATSGIGKLTAKSLINKNYIVYPTGKKIKDMNELKKLGAKPLYLDVENEISIKKAIKQIIKEQGRIDVLINNAGYGSYGPIENVPIKEAQHQFNVNLFGYARVQNQILPHMRKQKSGLIIQISSVVSYVSTPCLGWYSASKHALKAMSDSLRQEVKHLGIKVVQIEPGAIKNTQFNKTAFKNLKTNKTSKDYKNIVLGFKKYIKKTYKKAATPQNTVKTITKIIDKKNPKPQYRTTIDSKTFILLTKILTKKMTDKIILILMKK